MQTLLSKHWHHLNETEVAHLLDSEPELGLDLFEVQRRQNRFGPNRLAPPKGTSPLKRFLLQLNNPLIVILLAAAGVTAFIKDLVDAVIILGVVLINAVIGYIQEARAEQAIEALARAMHTEASVIRAGENLRIPASELVPGDLVQLRSGDKVPADLRLIRSRDLQIAEAALTGESLPVNKQAGLTMPENTPLAERLNMTYTSTLVTAGQGLGLVTAIGQDTEIGRISALIAGAESLATPLTRKIARFSRLVLYLILTLAGLAFLIGILRGQPLVDTFTAAVALAVAMIPEGLPAALTVTLAIGVSRMARRRAIIRKLPAVEALGSTTVICSDKTGTLTQNQMTVRQIWQAGERFDLSGSGYEPLGELLDQGSRVDMAGRPGLQELLVAGMLCNDSDLRQVDGSWLPEGDPTEVALLVAGEKTGLERAGWRRLRQRLDSLPFESQNQFMASLHRLEDGRMRVYLKGCSRGHPVSQPGAAGFVRANRRPRFGSCPGTSRTSGRAGYAGAGLCVP